MNDSINVKFKEFRKSVKMGQTLGLLLNFVKDIEFNDKLEASKKKKNESPEILQVIRKVEGRKKSYNFIIGTKS